MHRPSQSNNYKNYPYMPPPNSINSIKPTTSPNTNYYEPQTLSRENFYSNTTLIPTYTSECFQRLYQAPTTLSDLTDSSWVFDDIGPPPNYPATINALASGDIPMNGVKRSTVSDTRLATASTMREQLLSDILRDISDINEEISSIEGHLSRSRQFPGGFSPLENRDVEFRHRNLDFNTTSPKPNLRPKNAQIFSSWE